MVRISTAIPMFIGRAVLEVSDEMDTATCQRIARRE